MESLSGTATSSRSGARWVEQLVPELRSTRIHLASMTGKHLALLAELDAEVASMDVVFDSPAEQRGVVM